LAAENPRQRILNLAVSKCAHSIKVPRGNLKAPALANSAISLISTLPDVGFISSLMAKRVPLVVTELGRDVDPFMLHVYAVLAIKARGIIGQWHRQGTQRCQHSDRSWKAMGCTKRLESVTTFVTRPRQIDAVQFATPA
jgi:hypothetical protein